MKRVPRKSKTGKLPTRRRASTKDRERPRVSRVRRRSQNNKTGLVIAAIALLICVVVIGAIIITPSAEQSQRTKHVQTAKLPKDKKTTDLPIEPKEEIPQPQDAKPAEKKPDASEKKQDDQPLSLNIPQPMVLAPPVEDVPNHGNNFDAKVEITDAVGEPLIKPESKVDEVKSSLSPQEIFKSKIIEAYQSNDVNQYLALAAWCKKNDMTAEMNMIYRKIIDVFPDNPQARSALGFVRIRSVWVKESEAARLGYYKYQGKWCSVKDLKKRGLILYEGQWLTTAEAKERGLVNFQGRWIPKQEKAKLADSNDDSKNKTENDNEVKTGPLPKKRHLKINHQQIRIITHLGHWKQLSVSPISGKNT